MIPSLNQWTLLEKKNWNEINREDLVKVEEDA